MIQMEKNNDVGQRGGVGMKRYESGKVYIHRCWARAGQGWLGLALTGPTGVGSSLHVSTITTFL